MTKGRKIVEPKDDLGRKAEDFITKMLKTKFKDTKVDFSHYLSLRRRLISR